MTLLSPHECLVLGCMLAATAVLRAVYAARYADHDWILKVIATEGAAGGDRPRYHRRFDAPFAPLPFLWTWVDLLLAIRIGAVVDHPALWVLVMLFVAGRMRALQELGHNAVHCALARSRDWNWLLSNVFFQLPLMKRDMASRFITHVREHHRSPNHPDKDPNLRRIIEGGVRPGISPRTFHWRLLFPFTPRGFWINLRTSLVNSTRGNASWRTSVLRVVVIAATGAVLAWVGGARGAVLGYVVPLFVVYPWFSWISILVEHRWFAPDDAAGDRWQMECINCRPTAFPGLLGWLVGGLIFPLSDKYHLAHSLYPYVRWDYLPAIDKHLRATDPHYAVYASVGLLIARGDRPAALSELRQRLHAPRPGDLATWHARFAVAPSVSKEL